MRFAAIGAFDGLHLGHRSVIKSAGSSPGVILFEPVPKQYFTGKTWRKRLTTVQERHELLRANGITSIITLPFDRTTEAMSSEAFSGLLADIGLFDGFVVGYDFRFGKGASGTPEDLRELLRSRGLELRIAGRFSAGSETVKSGRIRELLLQRELKKASGLLGRVYGATGVVSRGRGLGRKLGFPTLNIRVPSSKLILPSGSYAAFAGIGCRRMKAVAFTSPERCLVEVHVPGLEGDIYGASASVEFVSFVRKPDSFRSKEKLKKKISEDLEISMEVLKEWQ
ncbi:hypothetical protein CSA37_03160 [Candidatus Fermentibacteria bacterium]|nr:MAG: hypothetical protein CSA37_03160 [Candidatus Fermentibacteria bacterium]